MKAKARLQAPIKTPYKGTLDVLTRTYKTEGFLALYRGFGAIVVGGTPGTMAYLMSYDYVKEQLSSTEKNIPEFAVHFTSGMLAETFACIIYVPVDVIKERLQVQRSIDQSSRGAGQAIPYKGSYDALKQILKCEGLGGIYKGYGATLASFGPYSAVFFVAYERLKQYSRKHLYRNETNTDVTEIGLPFYYTVGCSAGAGAFASFLTSPLDMAKLRLQIQRGQSSSSGLNTTKDGTNMIECLQNIYKEGGLRGLFRGAGSRVLHWSSAMTITMTSYEECRNFYRNALCTS